MDLNSFEPSTYLWIRSIRMMGGYSCVGVHCKGDRYDDHDLC